MEQNVDVPQPQQQPMSNPKHSCLAVQELADRFGVTAQAAL